MSIDRSDRILQILEEVFNVNAIDEIVTVEEPSDSGSSYYVAEICVTLREGVTVDFETLEKIRNEATYLYIEPGENRIKLKIGVQNL